MDSLKIIEHARQLFEAHGDKAEAEAAQKASSFEAEGDNDQAEIWKKIRNAIHEMRQGHQS